MNRLYELRTKKNLSLRDLSEKVKISYSKLNLIENGKAPMTQKHMDILSDFFNVSINYLRGIDDINEFKKSAKKIPIYSQVNVDHGGNILMQKEFIQEYFLVPEHIDESDTIGLTANDDSMKNSGIMSGDILLISKKGLIENNSIVAVAIGGGAAVVRKHVILEDKILLVSDLGIETKDNNHFILGKVIAFYRVF
jgi:SOS-response transcriptional repressor LexA